jgi:nucleoside-diphosphate-sugar epimerase
MRVLVTGATGFVGCALVPALAQRGYQVRAAVRGRGAAPFPPNVGIVPQGDLAAPIDWVPLVAGCDAIVHLAGIAHTGSGISDDRYDGINHRATAELAKAAERTRVKRLIFVSSIRAQSGPAADHVLTETDDARPTDAYGASKLAAEIAVRASGLRYTILRPVLVYGPGVKGNLAALVRLADSNHLLPFGSISSRRSLLNRASLIDAITFALQNAAVEGETYIVADRRPITLKDMVAALRRGLGRERRLVPIPRFLLRAALQITGRGDLLERLDGELIAYPTKLITAGWRPTEDTASELEQLAREMIAS